MDLERVQFVHIAIPELTLDEVSIFCRIPGLDVVLSTPIAILCSDQGKALRISRERAGVLVLLPDGSGVVDGKNVRLNPSHKILMIKNGLDAAKAVRIDETNVPVIDEADRQNLHVYERQLRIAMFLTASSNIAELRKAAIYTL
jgi:hypothetical protein